MLILSSFDLELPIDCDDEYWENDDPARAFIQPPDTPSASSFFVCYAKLLEIAGLAHRMLVGSTVLFVPTVFNVNYFIVFSKEAAYREESHCFWS